MALVTGTLGSVIPKFLMLLRDEYNLQKGLRMKIQSLSRDLEIMHAALRKVAQVPPEELDEPTRLWARDVRELSYYIEDKLDTFLVAADYPDPAGLNRFKFLLRSMLINLFRIKNKKNRTHLQIVDGNIHQIDTVIKELDDLVEGVAKRRHRYRPDRVVGRPPTDTVDPRLPALYRNERDLVGIDEARDELATMLALGGEQRIKIVSILGPGGVGKTTLAKAVYNKMLEEQFDCRAFVQVSRNPNLKKVFEALLLEFDEKYCLSAKPMDERQFIDNIREFLHHKRFLIVFDDIWESESWQIFKCTLIENNCGSRVITTTRNSHVAETVDGSTYRVKSLSQVNSKILFYKRIFGGSGNSSPDDQLPEVTDKIMKTCGGLPLAIITAASVLASKPREEWSEVHASIAFRHVISSRYVDNMRMVLSSSYYDLPLHLRACLLHLSVFPDDSWIQKDFLIWKWIAEGFIDKEQGTRLFEVGEEYFNVLVNRSLIQKEMVNDNRYKGPVDGCRVHPMMLSLIRYLSVELGFSFLRLDNETQASPKNDSNVRRLAMYKRNVEHNVVQDKMSWSELRSFNATLCFIDGMPELSSFEVLRVLALEYCPGMDSNHLKPIGSLVHLKYLGLLGTTMLELPEEVVQGLWFLQTLDLRETGIRQLPQTVIKLKQLMCLCADGARTVPEGMGMLQSLEELRLHYVSRSNSMNLATELGTLISLRVLVIGFEEIDERLEKILVESLNKLYKIQHLQVCCESSTRAVTWGGSKWVPPRCLRQLVVGAIRFPSLPTWMDPSDFRDLFHLTLELEFADNEVLKKLGNLRGLRSLMLVTTRDEKQGPSTINTVDGNNLYPALRLFTTNVRIRFECKVGPPMPSLEDLEIHVNMWAAKNENCWFGSLPNLPSSFRKVTVVLKCRGAPPAEVEEAKAVMMREVGILRQTRPALEVITEIEANEAPLVEKLHIKNPYFEALQAEREEMKANRQVCSLGQLADGCESGRTKRLPCHFPRIDGLTWTGFDVDGGIKPGSLGVGD